LAPPFYTKNASFCQDRLGTKRESAQKTPVQVASLLVDKHRAVLAARQALVEADAAVRRQQRRHSFLSAFPMFVPSLSG